MKARLTSSLLHVALALTLAACGRAPEAGNGGGTAALRRGDPVEGLRVATRVGCNGCHAADGGGQVFNEDDWGLFVAPNLTQRRQLYDDNALVELLRHGRTADGHPPVMMPVKMLQHLSDREIRDITAWLRALPPVNAPGLPEKRWTPRLRQALTDGTFPYRDHEPTPGLVPLAMPPREPLALGRHLALTSCSECHGQDLNGWPSEAIPSLVVAKAYSPEAFRRLMRAGVTATGRESATGLMSRMGRERFHVMTDTEIAALKTYLDAR